MSRTGSEPNTHQTHRIPAPRQLGAVRRFTFESDFFTSPCAEIVVDGKPLRYVESSRLAEKRLQTLFTKEPTTIPWLEAIGHDELLVDVGANIGMYTIYAAVFTGCRVVAFEPEALNYAELNKNIFVNGLHDRVSAFCIALSDVARVDHLQLGAFGISYSHHDFGENTWTEDKVFGDKSTPKDRRLRQGCVAARLDDLIDAGVLPCPQHIKIDVDGLEHAVVDGCRRTIVDPRLRTILVEISFAHDECVAFVERMQSLGWHWSLDQLRANRKMILPPELIERYQRERFGGFNYIFFRDPVYAELFTDFLARYVPPAR